MVSQTVNDRVREPRRLPITHWSLGNGINLVPFFNFLRILMEEISLQLVSLTPFSAILTTEQLNLPNLFKTVVKVAVLTAKLSIKLTHSW